MDNKICPLIKQVCNEKCAWYIKHQGLCAIVLLADDVRDITAYLEDSQNEN